MTDDKWTIQYGSEHNTVMASKIVESAEPDLMRIPYTFLPQFDDVWFDINDTYSVAHAMSKVGGESAELGKVLLRSGMTKTRLLDFTGLSKGEVIGRIAEFYKHKTYRKTFETHGSCFYGFMINVVKGEPPIIMLDR
jgi:hypothetical protein